MGQERCLLVHLGIAMVIIIVLGPIACALSVMAVVAAQPACDHALDDQLIPTDPPTEGCSAGCARKEMTLTELKRIGLR